MSDINWNLGWYARKGKLQYLALLEATGSPLSARALAKEVIVWLDGFPPEKALKDWELAWQDEQTVVSEKDVRKMRQRLMANEEWRNRAAIGASRRAVMALAEKAASGDLEAAKQVQLQYAGMNVAYMTKETAAAFGSPKPTPTQIGNAFFIDQGTPRRQRVKAPKRKELTELAESQIIDAEVREIVADTGP